MHLKLGSLFNIVSVLFNPNSLAKSPVSPTCANLAALDSIKYDAGVLTPPVLKFVSIM